MTAFNTNHTTYGSLNMAGHIGSTLTSMTRPNNGSSSMTSHVRSTLASMTDALSTWNNARVTRNALQNLSNRELDDIGLVRGDIDMIAQGRAFR